MMKRKGVAYSYPSDKLRMLIRKFMMFPGVGEKTAVRFALFLAQAPSSFVESLAHDILEVKRKVGLCKKCFFVSDGNLCRFCSDESRDKKKICVVEGIEDVISIERAGVWDGLYHVLWGVLSAQEGADPSELKVKELIERVVNDGVKEVLVFTDTTVEGEATAMYIKKLLSKFDVEVTRPAYGMPFGVEVEFMDPSTLKRALKAREKM